MTAGVREGVHKQIHTPRDVQYYDLLYKQTNGTMYKIV